MMAVDVEWWAEAWVGAQGSPVGNGVGRMRG
jgi:hypothetical protein